MLRRRCVALITEDPALYAELAGTLRERRIPSVSLLPGQRIPAHAVVALTSTAEASRISHAHVLAVSEDVDRRSLWAAVEIALEATEGTRALVVGIDPGPRPGYAVLSGEHCVAQGVLESPEEVAPLAIQLHRRFDSQSVTFRVGSGDHLARDRIVNALLPLRRPVEIVDEQGTTPRGHRRPRDAAAARAIALHPGQVVRDRMPLTVTAGEVANLQRLSREGSGGRFTIPRELAHRVLRGELTLNEALAEGRQQYRMAPIRRPDGPPRRRESS
ncbi:MAG: hypothetical protein WB778_06705 [Thermoplasmata archaeon]